ncbi:MAG: hypothetical protein ABJB74_09720 [Gemmatimonas sp.]
MDVGSPEHLERLRDRPEVKAALLRLIAVPESAEVRFERTPKNVVYWPPIESLSERILSSGCVTEVREPIVLYGRPCVVVATGLAASPKTPYAIAVVSADGAPVESLVKVLQDVCRDYWYGSYFFK